MTLISLFAVMVCHAQQKTSDAVQDVNPSKSRELIKQWVQTERLISEEKTSWEVKKQQMQDLLEIYKKELTLLSEELDAAGGAAELIDVNKEKLESDLTQYREAKRILRSSMAGLVPRMRSLSKRLPEPLQEELTADIDFINTDAALDAPRDTLKSIISILNAAGNFNRTMTLAEETRSLANGKKITVNVLYLGLCRAYYAADLGPLAGTGEPSIEGAWLWTENEGIADQVRKTIAVFRKSAQPQIVELPVQLQMGKGAK
jgi:hypothetical protein